MIFFFFFLLPHKISFFFPSSSSLFFYFARRHREKKVPPTLVFLFLSLTFFLPLFVRLSFSISPTALSPSLTPFIILSFNFRSSGSFSLSLPVFLSLSLFGLF
uniref:Uncharacterized protein n=1 Tax=Cacopsylla melanoneura TaxID=428564 RepID=A0A8D8YMW0_9HEMI